MEKECSSRQKDPSSDRTRLGRFRKEAYKSNGLTISGRLKGRCLCPKYTTIFGRKPKLN